MAGAAVPADEIEGLVFAKTERRLDVVNADLQQDATLLGAVCFIDDEIAGGSGRGVAPDDQDALGGFQFS